MPLLAEREEFPFKTKNVSRASQQRSIVLVTLVTLKNLKL